jgi:ribosomal protein L35
MGKTLTTKSFSKRIRITKNGKAIRRKMGVNHFKTRKNANGIRSKRNTLTLNMTNKQISAFK